MKAVCPHKTLVAMTEFRRLLGYLKPYRGIFLLSVVLMIATGLLEGGTILLLQPIFDAELLTQRKRRAFAAATPGAESRNHTCQKALPPRVAPGAA